MEVDDDQLVAAYWTYARLAHSKERAERLAGDEWYWAWDAVHERVSFEATIEDAVQLILRLVDAAPEGEEGYIGAGPVEDFLAACGGPALDAIVSAAARNTRLARALSTVIPPGGLTAGQEARLAQFRPPSN
jgi:hypothetical protein